MLSFLLFVVVLILNNLSLFLNIRVSFAILDNRLHFFNNNTKITIFIKDIKIILLNTITIILKHLIIERISILYFAS